MSAIYSTATHLLHHRRFEVREHEFRYRLALAYIDLDELPTLLGGRLLASRPGPARFRRRTISATSTCRWLDAVRDVVAARTGVRPSGPIRLLTNLSSFGHCFNPVSFYYCMDEAAESVEAVLAEVTNTPWGERHAYVLARGSEDCSPARTAGAGARRQFAKALHVSPFMGMDHRYEWRVSVPGETLSVHIASSREGRPRVRRHALAAPARAHEGDACAHERALSGERAADARADLRPGGASEAEGRANVPSSQRRGLA